MRVGDVVGFKLLQEVLDSGSLGLPGGVWVFGACVQGGWCRFLQSFVYLPVGIDLRVLGLVYNDMWNYSGVLIWQPWVYRSMMVC